MILFIKNILRRFGIDLVRYRPFWNSTAKTLAPRTVLDIGANDGVFAKRMRSLFPQATIYSFEPLQDCFDELNKKMEGDTKFKAWCVALGDSTGEVEMHRSSFHPSSSLLPMAALHKKLYPKTAGETLMRVPIARLDDVLQSVPLESPVLIKMDVQGYEAQVIRGGEKTLVQADLLVVETSFAELYEGQPLFGDIHGQLQSLGFVYRGRAESHYHPQTGELIYEDSIFAKR